MRGLSWYEEIKRIINDPAYTPQEAMERVNEMKELARQYQSGPGLFQKFLDWQTQPRSVGAFTIEEAQADVIVMKGYWEALAIRDQASIPQIHKHVHLHGVNGEHLEMVKIQQELDELEEKKRELKLKMKGY